MMTLLEERLDEMDMGAEEDSVGFHKCPSCDSRNLLIEDWLRDSDFSSQGLHYSCNSCGYEGTYRYEEERKRRESHLVLLVNGMLSNPSLNVGPIIHLLLQRAKGEKLEEGLLLERVKEISRVVSYLANEVLEKIEKLKEKRG